MNEYAEKRLPYPPNDTAAVAPRSVFETVAGKWAGAKERLEAAKERCARASAELEEAQAHELGSFQELVEMSGRGPKPNTMGRG